MIILVEWFIILVPIVGFTVSVYLLIAWLMTWRPFDDKYYIGPYPRTVMARLPYSTIYIPLEIIGKRRFMWKTKYLCRAKPTPPKAFSSSSVETWYAKIRTNDQVIIKRQLIVQVEYKLNRR